VCGRETGRARGVALNTARSMGGRSQCRLLAACRAGRGPPAVPVEVPRKHMGHRQAAHGLACLMHACPGAGQLIDAH